MSGEETLDVEAVHARAPGAKTWYYASASCFDNDFLATLARVENQNKAQIDTLWGIGSGPNTFNLGLLG